MHARRRAFTLIELLVVIGIIALLLSILLPALTTARAAGVRIQCMSNIQQLAMGVVQYQSMFRNRVPPGITAGNISGSFCIRVGTSDIQEFLALTQYGPAGRPA